MAKKVEKVTPAPTPVAGRVVILPETREPLSPGGIVLPDCASDAPQTGIVLAVDPKREDKDTYVRVNDRVLYSPYAQVVKVDGAELVILPERDILAIL